MDVRCENFRVDEKGGLRGFCDLVIEPLGVRLFSCKLFRSGGREWVQFPSREYESKANGIRRFVPTIGFTTGAGYETFQSAALKAIRAFRRQPQQQAEPPRGTVQSGGHS